MSGIRFNPITSAVVVTPGNGTPRYISADREGNAYVRNLYVFNTANEQQNLLQLTQGTDVTTSGALTSAQLYGVYKIGGGSATTLTLPTPVAADNGKRITIVTTTAQAHVVNFGGANYAKSGPAPRTTATSSGVIGRTIDLIVSGTGYYPLNQDTDSTANPPTLLGWTLA